MERKQRLLCALKGESIDRVPVSFWAHFPGASRNPQEQKQLAQQHLDFYQKTHVDFIKIMYDGLDAPFDPAEIQTVSDLKSIVSSSIAAEYQQAMLLRAQYTNDLLKNEVYTYFNLFSPFMLLRKIGDEHLSIMIGQNRQAVQDALERLAEYLAQLEQSLLTEIGCFGLFCCFQGAEKNRFDRETYEQLVRPSDLIFLSAANEHSPYNMAHFCAWDGNQNDLERWKDYPACAVNWAIHIDGHSLSDGKQYFGNRTVMGGFDNRKGTLLYSGNRQDVVQKTHELITEYRINCGNTNGLILGADCSFLPPIQWEHFRWVVEAAESWKNF